MRIALRFAAGTSVAVALPLAGAAWVMLQAERRDLLGAAAHEVETLARSVQVSVESALRDRQPLDVQRLFERVELVNPEITMVFTTRRGLRRSSDPSRASTDPALDALLQRAQRDGVESWEGREATHEAIRFVAPLVGEDGAPFGALAIVRPLQDVREDLARTRVTLAGAIALALALLAALTYVLSELAVARPIAQMVRAMHRVRAGDLTSALTPRGRDEVADVGRAFDAMVKDLATARQQSLREADARRQIESSLARADKLVTIGQLAAGLAHEIGTPLHVVAGRARSLAGKADDAAEVRRIADIIVEQTERIARVVEQLLSYARKRPASSTEVNPEQPIRAVLDLLESEAKRRGVTLALRVDDVLVMHANPDQLQQVILNLVRNALAATPPGGQVTVAVARGQLPDGPSTRPAARITVTDTGRGIAEADVPHLFEPFFTTRAAEGGTGLGLAVVRSIVWAHGGSIDVQSALDQGTTFVVLLPLAVDKGRAEEVAA